MSAVRVPKHSHVLSCFLGRLPTSDLLSHMPSDSPESSAWSGQPHSLNALSIKTVFRSNVLYRSIFYSYRESTQSTRALMQSTHGSRHTPTATQSTDTRRGTAQQVGTTRMRHRAAPPARGQRGEPPAKPQGGQPGCAGVPVPRPVPPDAAAATAAAAAAVAAGAAGATAPRLPPPPRSPLLRSPLPPLAAGARCRGRRRRCRASGGGWRR